METNENHALTKAEGCYHCKPLVQQRNELAAQVERLQGDLAGCVSDLKAQWQAEAVDHCEKEVTASFNVLLKPHIAGVFAVIRHRAQEAGNA